VTEGSKLHGLEPSVTKPLGGVLGLLGDAVLLAAAVQCHSALLELRRVFPKVDTVVVLHQLCLVLLA
jgi:hypothetical protein